MYSQGLEAIDLQRWILPLNHLRLQFPTTSKPKINGERFILHLSIWLSTTY